MTMAADSDGRPRLGSTARVNRSSRLHGVLRKSEEDNDLIQTVFTCHGNLDDPDFPLRLKHLLDQLSTILTKGECGLMRRIKKVEPWNSVRVTLSIPREAAVKLRALAAAGDAALQALGILSVQLEGDQVISLRLAAQAGAEPQEIILRSNGPIDNISTTSSPMPVSSGPVTALLQAIPGPSGSSSGDFKSPNVVAPVTKSVIPPSPRPHSGPSPFPFTSMTHAAQTQQVRQEGPHHNFTPPPPPPPYSAKSLPPTTRVTSHGSSVTKLPPKPCPPADTTVSLASPLLVNLLQTEGKEGKLASPKPRMRAPIASPTPCASPTPPGSLRPSFNGSKEVPSLSVSVPKGFSQFTAVANKPSSSKHTNEVPENDVQGKKLIINPLTGELEPMPSESSDSDEEAPKDDHLFCPSSPSSRHSDDNSQEDVWPNSRRGEASDVSDGEGGVKSSGPEIPRRRTSSGPPAPEKIKLRLMLDKPEAGAAPAQAYKVDLSFSPTAGRKPVSSSGKGPNSPPAPGSSTLTSEELRVPPLHISLRGRNATVVSNKKMVPWLLDKEDLYSKMPKKKLKLGGGVVKDGRDSTAITNCDSSATQKPKRGKLKRLVSTVDGERFRLKIPMESESDEAELTDDKLIKKRKDSKKVKNNQRCLDGEATYNLKMDSEEWISRTLKEETLRHSLCLPGNGEPEQTSDNGETASVGRVDATCSVSTPGEPRVPPVEETDVVPPAAVDPTRTSGVLKPGNVELSELLFCKDLENGNKTLDCLKVKNNILLESSVATAEVESSSEGSSVKKPQAIGGKIKSELTSKIDRVSGKLKNDLSKDASGKRKSDDGPVKAVKIRSKSCKKESSTRITGLEGQPDDLTLNRAKRRHSGDLSTPESQAQKVKRSSSSDQPTPLNRPLILGNRRLDTLSRKIRKDHVIDRLRKDKLVKVSLNAKLNPVSDLIHKKVAAARVPIDNSTVKLLEENTPVSSLTTLPTEVVPDSEKIKEAAPVEGNTQGEDSGIESMDALSEKSPNQGESPCRKDDDGKKGQNHDRTAEEEAKELHDNCLSMGNSNQKAHPPQAHPVPFECNSHNNNSAQPELESTSTKLPESAEDGLIDSFGMKILEAFRRDEDPSREGLAAKILEGSTKDWAKPPLEPHQKPKDSLHLPDEKNVVDVKPGDGSPSLEDMERFRVNPPLYTYAKREDSLSPSPTDAESEDRNHVKELKDDDGEKSSPVTRQSIKAEEAISSEPPGESNSSRSLRKQSLLEQLLIEIPEETRRTRSWHKLGNSPGDTPKNSPRPGSPSVARASPRASKHSPTQRTKKRPTKRKCSENAAELIKACMGVDEGKSIKPNTNVTWKKGDVDSSDDEPLSDLARCREPSYEQESKPAVLKNKVKQIHDEESRNNNKVGMKVVAETPTRRSGRMTQGSHKALRAVAVSDVRSVRSTRSAPCQETCDTGNKRRRTSRDGK